MADIPISQERMKIIEPQYITISDFECSGYILDIGGGGEGIIGRLKGKSVIAIDPNKSELQELPVGEIFHLLLRA